MTLDSEAFDAEADALDASTGDVEAATASAESAMPDLNASLSPGGLRALRVTEFLAKALVDDPTGVEVDAIGREGETKLIVRAAPGETGRLIGRRGRTVQAMRQLARAAAAADNERVQLDVVD